MDEYVEIEGYPNYRISNTGKVWSDRQGIQMKQGKHYKGYLRLRLIDRDNNRKTVFVHRLVAIGFIQNPNNLKEINHKDGNKGNNHVDNLEWISHRDNMIHAYNNKLSSNMMETHPSNKLSCEDVLEIRNIYVPYKTSRPNLAKRFGVSTKTISDILSRKKWKHI